MAASRAIRIRRISHAVLAVTYVMAATTLASIIIEDDFSSDPALNPRYQALGSAELIWDTSDPANPKFRVHVFNTGDGLQIEMPDDPDLSAKCMHLFQDIDNREFPQGFAWRHSIEMENELGESGSVVLTASRSFWNRCEYTLRWGSMTVVSGFLLPAKAGAAKWECPGGKDVQFDWLPPAEGETEQRIQIEVQSKVPADCQFQTTKKSGIVHFEPGQDPPANAFRITRWKIEAEVEDTRTPRSSQQADR